MKKNYTFLIMTNGRQGAKKIVLPRRQIFWGLGALAVIALGISCVFLDYASLLYKERNGAQLALENKTLKAELTQISKKMSIVEKSLQRLDVFAKKLRIITQVDDPDRDLELAMGKRVKPQTVPVFKSYSDGNVKNVLGANTRNGGPAEVLEPDPDLSIRMDMSVVNAELQEKNLLELWQNLSDRIELLGSTPSILPTSGWITSNFGYRKSPFRGHKVMHKGLDIAAAFGTPVTAPAAGVVSYVGYDGGYGNLVTIDHGYGVVTRYGHNAKVHVKYGQRVDRGELIASVGNTGKSTGPHLHYEVRVNGIPVDPKRYILSE